MPLWLYSRSRVRRSFVAVAARTTATPTVHVVLTVSCDSGGVLNHCSSSSYWSARQREWTKGSDTNRTMDLCDQKGCRRDVILTAGNFGRLERTGNLIF
jgi:hypothetical protein